MRVFIVAAVVALILALPATAGAEHLYGSADWQVTFNSNASMVDNYSQEQWADDIGRLQPGDDITFTVTLKHEHPTACDWYMANEVLKSLEESFASGSAYSYYLTYTGPAGGDPRVLYDSTHVGGDDSAEGLKDATSGLEDFFYLDTLKNGDVAQVQLVVGLDGETEGNAYFDTLAQVKMKFAVEYDAASSSSSSKKGPATSGSSRSAVQTGDDTNLFPFFIAMAVSGALLLLLALYGVRERRHEREGGRR